MSEGRTTTIGSEADLLQHLPDPLFKPGDLCGGYEIEILLARGGSADVYRARHLFLNVVRALKIMRRGTRDLRSLRKRLVREARNVVTIDHPNVVKVLDGGEHDGRAWIAMELVPDGLLRDRIVGQPLPIVAALRYAIAVCEGVDAAHRKGLVHRDVKPENIGMKADAPVVLDFGIARRLGIPHGMNTSRALLGTPAYSSPEYLSSGRDDGPVDERTDVYSIGHILYELFLGRHAYACPDGSFPPQGELIRKQIEPHRGYVTPLPELLQGFPAYLWREVQRAMCKDAEQRHANAGELASALRGALTRFREERSTRDDFYEQVDREHRSVVPGGVPESRVAPEVSRNPALSTTPISYHHQTSTLHSPGDANTAPTFTTPERAFFEQLPERGGAGTSASSSPESPSSYTLPPTDAIAASWSRVGVLTGVGVALGLAMVGGMHAMTASSPVAPGRAPLATSVVAAPRPTAVASTVPSLRSEELPAANLSTKPPVPEPPVSQSKPKHPSEGQTAAHLGPLTRQPATPPVVAALPFPFAHLNATAKKDTPPREAARQRAKPVRGRAPQGPLAEGILDPWAPANRR